MYVLTTVEIIVLGSGIDVIVEAGSMDVLTIVLAGNVIVVELVTAGGVDVTTDVIKLV